MEEVHFEEMQTASDARSDIKKETGNMVPWLIKRQLVKSERQANYVLLTVVLACFLAIVLMLTNLFSRRTSNEELPPALLQKFKAGTR